MTAFDLVIWDCDGCLVDSELLTAEAEAKLMTQLGAPLTTQECYERYTGVSLRTMFDDLEAKTGLRLRDQYDVEAYERDFYALLAEKLQPMEHVIEALDKIALPMCVASGSVPRKLEHELRVTKLWDRFAGRTYSSDCVAKGKPEPDIFLYAAAQMGADPARCLVIEDSVAGVTAGKAAGMTVFAFKRNGACSAETRRALISRHPDAIFSDMARLPELMERWQRA